MTIVAVLKMKNKALHSKNEKNRIHVLLALLNPPKYACRKHSFFSLVAVLDAPVFAKDHYYRNNPTL